MNNFSKTLIIAFLFSIVIHTMLFVTIDRTLKNDTLKINTTNKKNDTKNKGLVKVKYVKIKQKAVKPTKKVKKYKEKAQTKKIQKRETKKAKIAKKTVPLIKLPVIQKKQLDLKQFFTIQKQEEKVIEQKQTKAIERQQEIQEIQKLPAITQSYIKLYGEQYFEFSEYQRRYLKQNLNTIGKITQRFLRYPKVSIRTKQKGMNVVEFYLHPNGDITDLKLADSSYYTALDTNSIDTIRIAYQDYPRPLEKVKIKIYIKYILY